MRLGNSQYPSARPSRGVAGGGALKPKALDGIVVEVPRAEVQAARYKKGMAVGVFELEFADGSTWAFDVGRAFAKSAGQVAAELGATVD